ncbi:MAG: helix-turn-helix domain-containing protein [Candidatus Methylomirabilales bacterium]
MRSRSLWLGVGKRLREARGQVSQTDFGRAVGGYHQDKVSRYEHGTVRPPLEYLVRVAELKEVSLDWLVRGVGQGPSPAEFGRGKTGKRTHRV